MRANTYPVLPTNTFLRSCQREVASLIFLQEQKSHLTRFDAEGFSTAMLTVELLHYVKVDLLPISYHLEWASTSFFLCEVWRGKMTVFSKTLKDICWGLLPPQRFVFLDTVFAWQNLSNTSAPPLVKLQKLIISGGWLVLSTSPVECVEDQSIITHLFIYLGTQDTVCVSSKRHCDDITAFPFRMTKIRGISDPTAFP